MADVKPLANGTATPTPTDVTEVESLRAALADARADAAKRAEQLEAAKSKAKDIIRAQQKKASEAQAKLENDAKQQQKTIDDLTRRITQLVPPPDTSPSAKLEQKIQVQANAKFEQKIRAQEKTIADLMNKIKQLVPPPDEHNPSASTAATPEPAKKLAALRDRIANVTDVAQTKVLAADCKQIERDVVALADDFLAAKTALTLAQEDGRTASRAAGDARKEGRDLRGKANALEKTVTELKKQLKAAEKAPPPQPVENKSELEKQIAQLKDEKEALDVKLAGMDAILTEKNAELTKVRDKARAYLKEINADKRAMEVRLKAEMDALKEKLADANEEIKKANDAAAEQDGELERVLALVSEKQKTIQSLNMACASERKAVADSVKRTEMLRDEFAKYKERARVALEERDTQLAKSDTAVQDATVQLREQLELLQTELTANKKALAVAQKTAADAKYNMERAVRAETALDLQRSSASSEASLHDARVRKVEQELDEVREQLDEATNRAKDAENRSQTLASRLANAENKASQAAKQVNALQVAAAEDAAKARAQVASLRTSLAKSNESASAAQRVAAVAARAMGAPSPGSSGQGPTLAAGTPGSSTDARSTTPRGSPATSAALSPLLREARSEPDGLSRFTSDSLQKVMESHATSLGIGSPRESTTSFGDDTFRDNQVAVLTSQLSELSTLLDDAQEESKAREMQNNLLKDEVAALGKQLNAAQKLAAGAPFSYLRSVVVSYLENPDPNLLPVLADVLAISKDEIQRIRSNNSSNTNRARPPRQPNSSGMLAFLGRR